MKSVFTFNAKIGRLGYIGFCVVSFALIKVLELLVLNDVLPLKVVLLIVVLGTSTLS